jgi:hypothetical protein
MLGPGEQLGTQLTKKAVGIAAEPVARHRHPEHARDERQRDCDSKNDPKLYTALIERRHVDSASGTLRATASEIHA